MLRALLCKVQTEGEFEKREFLGQTYMVIPVVSMIEGVRHGALSDGSGELGLQSEFGKFVQSWNGKPVVYNHPKVDNNYVSAVEMPTVLEENYLGMTMNSHIDDGKLKQEVWLNESLRGTNDKIDEVFNRIENQEVVEVSVGFFTDIEEVSGEFKGQSYGGVWRNIVPDHLAILDSDTIGACSVSDGCGIPRVNAGPPLFLPKGGVINGKENVMPKKTIGNVNLKINVDTLDLNKTVKKLKNNKKECTCDKNPSCCSGSNAVVLNASKPISEIEVNEHNKVEITIEEAQAIREIIAQAIPSDTLSGDVYRALNEQLDREYGFAFFAGFTTDHVVFEYYDVNDSRWKLVRQAYDMDADGKVTFTADPEEVNLMTRIIPEGNAEESDINNQTKEETMQVDKTKVQESSKDKTPEEIKSEDSTVNTNKEPEINAEPKVQTAEEYVNSAPAEVKEVLQSAMSVHKTKKDSLIKGLQETGRCSFTEEQLSQKSLQELEVLAELADVPTYEGKGAPVQTNSASESNIIVAPKVFVKKKTASAE